MGNYSVRKQGECAECKAPLYGDDYGPLGHDCPVKIPDGWIDTLKRMPPQNLWVHVHIYWPGSDEVEDKVSTGYWTGTTWRTEGFNYLPEHVTHWHKFPDFPEPLDCGGESMS